MLYQNSLGQWLGVGDIVTHTTASGYADLSCGFIRGFQPADRRGRIKVQVTWVHGNFWGLKKGPIKTAVDISTLTLVNRASLGANLQAKLLEAKAGARNA